MKLLEAFIALFIFLSMFNINYRHYKRNKFTGTLNIEYLDLHFIFSIIAFCCFCTTLIDFNRLSNEK